MNYLDIFYSGCGLVKEKLFYGQNISYLLYVNNNSIIENILLYVNNNSVIENIKHGNTRKFELLRRQMGQISDNGSGSIRNGGNALKWFHTSSFKKR